MHGTPTALTPNLAAADVGVLASSMERLDLPATAAVDGSQQSRWSSAFADNQWLVVDLGTSMDIRRVVLRWEAAYAARYALDVSDDGLTWRPLVWPLAGDGGVDDLSVDGTGRYLRVLCSTRGTPWGFSLWEVEVYAGR